MFLSCQATCRAHSAELVIIDTPEENEFIRLKIIKLKGKKEKEKQKYRTVGTIPKSNRKIVARGKIDIPSMHIHCHSLSQLGTCTLMKKKYQTTHMTLETRPARHTIMAGLNQLIGSQSSPHGNWIPSSVLFLIVEHVNIDTACTSSNLISDVFNSI